VNLNRSTAFVLVLALACADRPGTFRPTPIKEELLGALARGPGARASLDSLGPENWRTMYLFGPYAATDLLRRCATPTGGVETHGIESRDDISVVWFRSETGRISSMTLGQDVSFTKEALNREYTRGSASFEVRHSLESGRDELAPSGSVTRSCR
jgi:hypothetical protein